MKSTCVEYGQLSERCPIAQRHPQPKAPPAGPSKRWVNTDYDATPPDNDRFVRLMDEWVGNRIISVSNNEDDNLRIGTVVDIIPITKANTPVPLVLFDGDEEPVIAMSTIMHHDEDVWNALAPLTPEARWKLIQAFVFRF
jgi:hypothetical protein